ncbi:MAG: hypothetical protein AB1487_00025 [Thermodesulfobacteriota bacterium]
MTRNLVFLRLKKPTLNMVARESLTARETVTALSKEKPDTLVRELKKIQTLSLPFRHEIQASDINPARYSFAHGGKDGHPYPVDRKTYDRSIELLHRAIEQSKVGRTEKMGAIKRLANFHLEPPYSLPL